MTTLTDEDILAELWSADLPTIPAPDSYDFSYRVHEQPRTFRFISPDGTTDYANRDKGFEGMVWIESADGQTGHMRMTMNIDRLNSGQMVFYLPDGYVADRIAAEGIVPPEGATFAELNQLCFARAQSQWRTWDKSRRNETLEFVDDYYGPAYVTWYDGGGHIFVHGRRWTLDIPGRGKVAMFAGDAPRSK